MCLVVHSCHCIELYLTDTERYVVVKIFGNGVKITWNGKIELMIQVKQNMKMTTRCKFENSKTGSSVVIYVSRKFGKKRKPKI